MNFFRRRTAAAALVFLCTAGAAWAGIERTPNDVAETNRGAAASKKLGRGLANVLGGWLELPKGIQSVGDESGFLAGLTWGPIYGIGNALVRTGAGVYDIATFPMPSEPVVQPEYVM